MLVGFSLRNHPFWVPHVWNPHMIRGSVAAVEALLRSTETVWEAWALGKVWVLEPST